MYFKYLNKKKLNKLLVGKYLNTADINTFKNISSIHFNAYLSIMRRALLKLYI